MTFSFSRLLSWHKTQNYWCEIFTFIRKLNMGLSTFLLLVSAKDSRTSSVDFLWDALGRALVTCQLLCAVVKSPASARTSRAGKSWHNGSVLLSYPLWLENKCKQPEEFLFCNPWELLSWNCRLVTHKMYRVCKQCTWHCYK